MQPPKVSDERIETRTVVNSRPVGPNTIQTDGMPLAAPDLNQNDIANLLEKPETNSRSLYPATTVVGVGTVQTYQREEFGITHMRGVEKEGKLIVNKNTFIVWGPDIVTNLVL